MLFSNEHDAAIRFGVFAGVFLTLAALELVAPRRSLSQPKGRRWFTNLSLIVIDTLALRIVMPMLAVGMAVVADQKGWGLLNLVGLPVWLEFIIALIIFDMLIYAQHVATHKIPILWRLHKVHHTDRDIDVTTASRFHPLEILASMAYKLLCIVLLGPSAAAMFVFEIILNSSTMFNHSNLRLPAKMDKLVRSLVVTPDMHRVHHSVLYRETDSNYGFFLSIWDRLFRTYRSQPEAGHDGMTIGQTQYQDQQPVKLGWSLLLPFLPNERTKN